MSAENPDFENTLEAAIVVPLETVVNGDGSTETICGVSATSPEAAEKAGDYLVENYDARELNPSESKKAFGFSNWKAPWNPEGPSKNWGYNPDSPANNN